MHYKHEWFEKAIVNASEKDSLKEAVKEWELSHFGVYAKFNNCQICHTSILKFVAIKNKRNGVYLLIGHDCYDKLLHYLATKKIEAVTLYERKKHIARIKQYCKSNINRAFLEWFSGRKNLPKEFKETLRIIKALGYAPSLEAAESLVEYYKNHRLFGLQDLLNWNEKYLLDSYDGSKRIPKRVTLNKLAKVQELLKQWQKELNNRRVAEEARRAEERAEAELKRQGLKKAFAEKLANFFHSHAKSGEAFAQSSIPGTSNCIELDVQWGIHDVPPSLYLAVIAHERTEDGEVSARFAIDLPHDYVVKSMDVFGLKLKRSLANAMPQEFRLVKDGDKVMLPSEVLENWLLQAKELADRKKNELELRQKEEEERRREFELKLELERQELVRKNTVLLEEKVSQQPYSFFKSRFWEGTNPKYKTFQWYFFRYNKKYVLDSDDDYESKEGFVYAKVTRELVLDRVFLVRRLDPENAYLHFDLELEHQVGA